MKLKFLIVCLSALMIGCSSIPTEVTPARVDPVWPDPIQTYSLKWEVKVIDGQAWVGMPFDESQQFRIWMNDIFRYTKDANEMICYYRVDLKEPRCLRKTK